MMGWKCAWDDREQNRRRKPYWRSEIKIRVTGIFQNRKERLAVILP